MSAGVPLETVRESSIENQDSDRVGLEQEVLEAVGRISMQGHAFKAIMPEFKREIIKVADLSRKAAAKIAALEAKLKRLESKGAVEELMEEMIEQVVGPAEANEKPSAKELDAYRVGYLAAMRHSKHYGANRVFNTRLQLLQNVNLGLWTVDKWTEEKEKAASTLRNFESKSGEFDETDKEKIFYMMLLHFAMSRIIAEKSHIPQAIRDNSATLCRFSAQKIKRYCYICPKEKLKHFLHEGIIQGTEAVDNMETYRIRFQDMPGNVVDNNDIMRIITGNEPSSAVQDYDV